MPFCLTESPGLESLTPTPFFFSQEADAQLLGSSGGDSSLPLVTGQVVGSLSSLHLDPLNPPPMCLSPHAV